MKEYVDEAWGWDEQFQKEYFKDRFETKHTQLILLDGSKIGVLEMRDRDNELFIANIEIAPDYQNKGIGSAILKRIINSVHDKEKTLKLQVLKVNPARRLYERLGFETTDKTETHFVMEKSVE